MKIYISKVNITYALKSGNVKFVKGEEVDPRDGKDFASRAPKGTVDRTLEIKGLTKAEIESRTKAKKEAEKK